MKHILKCEACLKYTIHSACICGGKCVSPRPAKYSPQDLYGKYRRLAKKEGTNLK